MFGGVQTGHLWPSTITPARASQPPVECTTVAPAKSTIPRAASHPPPRIQCPTMG